MNFSCSMAPSQLKQLKASLREQGIVGPQKSKKQKKQASNSRVNNDKRIARHAAIEGIRDKFNPFEVKKQGRPSKYQFANGPNQYGGASVARPGVTRGLGEETVCIGSRSFRSLLINV